MGSSQKKPRRIVLKVLLALCLAIALAGGAAFLCYWPTAKEAARLDAISRPVRLDMPVDLSKAGTYEGTFDHCEPFDLVASVKLGNPNTFNDTQMTACTTFAAQLLWKSPDGRVADSCNLSSADLRMNAGEIWWIDARGKNLPLGKYKIAIVVISPNPAFAAQTHRLAGKYFPREDIGLLAGFARMIMGAIGIVCALGLAGAVVCIWRLKRRPARGEP